MKTYTARLGTCITIGVDTRLRQLAPIRRQRINHLQDELRAAALPGAAELAAWMACLGRSGDASGKGDDQTAP